MKNNIQLLAQFLVNNKLTISSSESITGGLFASQLTKISGISKVYLGTIVAYQNEVKVKLLNVDQKVIDQYGAVSKQTALQMVNNVAKIFNSNIAVSFTGNAGPSKSEDKDVGLVYIGYKILDKAYVIEYRFKGSRNQIRNACIQEACKEIIKNV